MSTTMDALSSDERAEIQRVAREWEQNRRIDLVCEGGGVLGIGLVGAFSVLEEQNFKPQNLAGTSAGAIIATLIAAGYDAAAVKKMIFDEIDFKTLTDDTRLSKMPLVGRP